MFWEHSPYSTIIASDWLRVELSCGWRKKKKKEKKKKKKKKKKKTRFQRNIMFALLGRPDIIIITIISKAQILKKVRSALQRTWWARAIHVRKKQKTKQTKKTTKKKYEEEHIIALADSAYKTHLLLALLEGSQCLTASASVRQYGFRTFSCFGPHIWNSLPQDLRHCSTLSSFKAQLKTFLFSQYFRPN